MDLTLDFSESNEIYSSISVMTTVTTVTVGVAWFVSAVGRLVDVWRVCNVLSITRVGVAVGREGVRNGLGSKSGWDLVASDDAARNRYFHNIRFKVCTINQLVDNHGSSNDWLLTLKVLEEIHRTGSCKITFIIEFDALESTSVKVLKWIVSTILVNLVEGVVLLADIHALHSISNICTDSSVLMDLDLNPFII